MEVEISTNDSLGCFFTHLHELPLVTSLLLAGECGIWLALDLDRRGCLRGCADGRV